MESGSGRVQAFMKSWIVDRPTG